MLHYQRVQQLTAIINAIIGCIPVVGSITTNVICGGAAFLNDLQVCRLVESLLGTAKEFSTLGTDHLIDRFVSRGAQVLSVDQWLELSDEQHKLVEDAGRSLGLSVQELR